MELRRRMAVRAEMEDDGNRTNRSDRRSVNVIDE
jgi:hypothetical protein